MKLTSLRIFSACCFLILGSCDDKGRLSPDTIPCALDGETNLSNLCMVEVEQGRVTVRRPDGGFRRLTFSGGQWHSADGADDVIVVGTASSGDRTPDGTRIVEIDNDRYVLTAPASAK